MSSRAVQDHDDRMLPGGCNWASLPTEILRDALAKVEASEGSWPARRSVVACAGVCRSWRYITKDIVKVPEISGRLTFPISVKQPGPRDCLLRCFIKRSKSGQTYHLYLNVTHALIDEGKLLLVASKVRRPTCTDYIICLHSNEKSRGSSTCIGKLRSNFLGSKFTILDGQPPNAGASMTKSRSSRLANLKQVSPGVLDCNHPVGHISYELNMLGTRGPRKMECVMGSIPATAVEPGGIAPTQTDFSFDSVDPPVPLFHSKSTRPERSVPGYLAGEKDEALVLTNKSPRWHGHLQCWCLNFHGRVTLASVKNFQLVASGENAAAGPGNDVVLQFGKVQKDIFTMDYRYPLSAFQAFGICLSSFDTKIASFLHILLFVAINFSLQVTGTWHVFSLFIDLQNRLREIFVECNISGHPLFPIKAKN